jgi:hypothetical protein
MDMDQTDQQFTYWAKQVNIALKTGMPYVLREMSSIGPIGMPGVSDTFGASLWTLNFFLYAASLGISSVQMHITQISAIKTSPGSGYQGRIRMYSTYANNNLQAVVMINSKESNSSEAKNSYTFNLNLGSANANKNVYLSYLTAPGAESQTEVTWNGMSYDDVTGNSTLVDDSENKFTLDGSGKLSVQVRDSQAVIANIGSKLGVNLVLKPDPTQSKKSSAASSIMTGSQNAIYTTAVTIVLALAMVMC